MPVVVATRFRVRLNRYLPRFMIGNVDVARQARRSPGFLGGRLRAEPHAAVYWTLTVWESGRDMVAFRDTGVHAALAPKVATWASEAAFGIWNSDSTELPGWQAAGDRMAEHPNFASLDHPSPAHQERRFSPARRIGFDLPIPRTHKSRRRRSAGGATADEMGAD